MTIVRAIVLWVAAGITQAVPAKPIIDNERVTVWDVASTDPQSGHTPAGDYVVVTVGPAPGATYHAKGSAMDAVHDRAIIIDLHDKTVAPIENKTGYPLAFPRPGVKKLFENERVIIWDYTWTRGVATPMHFHDKDVVVVYVQNGALKSTTPDGQSTVNEFKAGTTRFNLRNRVHTEMLTTGNARAIITELK